MVEISELRFQGLQEGRRGSTFGLKSLGLMAERDKQGLGLIPGEAIGRRLKSEAHHLVSSSSHGQSVVHFAKGGACTWWLTTAFGQTSG